MHVRIGKGKTLIRLLLQKQSDLYLHCSSRPFWQATSVQNFRTFTVYLIIVLGNDQRGRFAAQFYG